MNTKANEYTILRATDEHAAELAATMRQADIDEIRAVSSASLEGILQRSILVSQDAQTCLIDGEVACMYGVGVTTLVSDRGVPWLLGSDLIEKHSRKFLRKNRVWMRETAKQFRHLSNYVDARNELAIRWLGWLGFTIEPALPHGTQGEPFHFFFMESPDV